MPARRESDLYQSVKRFLESRGFTVRAEVQQCDCVAVRGNDVVIVELKPSFTLALVMQGIDRQTMSDNVFLAVEAPKGRASRSRRDDMRRLCGRLGLGLLFVRFPPDGGQASVEVARECSIARVRRNKRRSALLIGEFARRSGDYNIGGSARRDGRTGRPVVTAYREDALRIARYLELTGESRLRDIRQAARCAKADAILVKNYYGWFARVKRGVYGLTEAGRAALTAYADVVGRLQE